MAKTVRPRHAWVTVLGVCIVFAVAPPSGLGKTRQPAPVTPGSRYLALGDSVTFGYEESTVVPPPNYKDASSFPGYPEQFGDAQHVIVANAACPGETSSSLINQNAPSNGCENAPNSGVGYRTVFPLHVKYKGSQLAYALGYLRTHKNVRLVSLMIGANDYFLCLETTKDGCTSASEQQAVLKKIAANVRIILSSIRNKAHYKGQLAIVHYYSLDYSSAATNARSQALNGTVDTAAKPFHVKIADGYGELKAAVVHFGGSTCGAGLLTQLGSPGKCGVHPSYAGQALLAQALAKAVRF